MVTFNEQKLLILILSMVGIQFHSLYSKYGTLVLQAPCIFLFLFF